MLLAPGGSDYLGIIAGAGWAGYPGIVAGTGWVGSPGIVAGAGWAGSPGGGGVQHSSPSRKTKPALEKIGTMRNFSPFQVRICAAFHGDTCLFLQCQLLFY